MMNSKDGYVPEDKPLNQSEIDQDRALINSVKQVAGTDIYVVFSECGGYVDN